MENFKKIFLVLIFIFTISFMPIGSYATNDEATSNIVNEISNEKVLTEAEAQNLIRESLEAEAYKKEFDEAVKKISEMPVACSLPTLFKQPTERPDITDFFGVGEDSYPIFKVKVSEGDSDKKNCIALSFDSAYINSYTYKILDILDEYNIKATFFMTYEFMSKNETQVMEIIKRGHEIGNHSTTHPDFNLTSDAKIMLEVMNCHMFLKNLIGVEMSLFRFPFGSYSPRTVKLLKNMGYYPIQWTFDSIDWKNLGKDVLINRFKNETKNICEGAIILFHNGATYTPEALPELIEMFKERGLKCVRVSDLIYSHDFVIENGIQREKK